MHIQTLTQFCSKVLTSFIYLFRIYSIKYVSGPAFHTVQVLTHFSIIKSLSVKFSSVAQSCLTLRPHGLQHTRPPGPSSTPEAYSNSRPLSWWCHPTISSSVVAFSSCSQSFPASGSFPRSQFFASKGHIGVLASASFLPMNSQDWFSWKWTGWISLQSKGLSRVFPNTTVQKH